MPTSALGGLYHTRRQFVDVLDFGADPTGTNDSATAFQAAIDAVEADGGGVVLVPAGVYDLGTALVANKGVLLKGHRADVASSTNGSITDSRPYIQWTGSADATMFTIQPASAGDVVWGGGSEGIEWDGASGAATAIHFDNCKFTTFDGRIRRTKVAGLVISSDSGSAANFSQCNLVKSLEFISAGSGAGLASHALSIRGNGVDVPGTQHRIDRVYGLIYNGNMVHLAEADNCQIGSIAGGTGPGGTGVGLNIWATGSAYRADNTVVDYIAGGVAIADSIVGTRIIHSNSEGQSFSTGSAIWHADVLDYVNGRLWRSHGYRLRDYLTIPGGSFVGSGTGTVAAGLQYWVPTLPESGASTLSVTLPAPYDWAAGTINTVELWLTTNGTSGGNIRLLIEVEVQSDGESLATPNVSDNVTVAQDSQYRIKKSSVSLSTPATYARGALIGLSITRSPADAADTSTDDIGLLGVRLGYVGTGPSTGSGPYTVPDWA